MARAGAKTGFVTGAHPEMRAEGLRILKTRLHAVSDELHFPNVIPHSRPPVIAMAYYVYLLASGKHGTMYIGVTNDLIRRGYEHRSKAVDGFTRRYGIDKLVWYEIYEDVLSAIAREKELKKWRRDWKIRLIEEQNPNWMDLYPGICG